MSEPGLLESTIARVAAVDSAAAAAAQRDFDAKTKPRGSLGHLETLACQVRAIRRSQPIGEAAIVVAAADHGIAASGVSAYPREVTAQMVANFAAGGAAINVLARQSGARLIVVDAGVETAIKHPSVRSIRIGAGTADVAAGPAMSLTDARRAIDAGIDLAAELAAEGVGLVAIGEMGIGNTTIASLLAACLLEVDPELVCGRGTGVDDAGLARKLAAIRQALTINQPDTHAPLNVLAALGGYEIAFLVGLILGAAGEHIIVVLDGFITAAAALVAARLAPLSRSAMIAAHLSPEPGHRRILDELQLEPLLDLGLRLGEASGAALAVPLIRSAVALLDEMATFSSAGVSDAGR
ncbi:MAG: nicotinate-nucleotide--dimethylbenzimidazole phosphoribosyltransferase [Sphingomonadales bacterium]|nr:nicotinate-nucleotide--dimethylbenzimidazole phosphoribosyltransferase [Sphingomonadales bacterium]